MRTLVISHGHPSFSIGGAEVASHTLYNGLNDLANHDAFYLANAPSSIHKRSLSPLMGLEHSERECFLQVGDWDGFWLSNGSISHIVQALSDYLRHLSPEIVHLHHVIGLGIEIIPIIRNTLPHAKIVITFHEYLAICNNHGQMVKTEKKVLCTSSSAHGCQVCFPSRRVAEFHERKTWITNHLDLADAFVSPSQFLIERYVSWGLKREKFTLIENGVVTTLSRTQHAVVGRKRNRFAYFGQISEFKGLHVLLDAISRVPEDVWGDASLSVFGGNLQFQPIEFQDLFYDLMRTVGRRAKFCGSYRQDELSGLMRDVDWVIVPSIWWENSPVVIQEAFLHGRPLIVSGIGGMAEKVQDGVNGLHFRVGSSESLADKIALTLTDRDLWTGLSASAAVPLSPGDFARRHIKLYLDLLNSSAGRPAAASLANAAQ